MSITYFAYGANLDVPAMQQRCPGAAVLEPATLADYRLVAMREGWLSITPHKGEMVQGLLWTLHEHHLPALDAYEDVADGLYQHHHLQVHTSTGTPIEALVYIGSNDGPGALHAEYGERVARAADAVLNAGAAKCVRSLPHRAPTHRSPE